jgi:flagellar biosynthesis/type III secretory pathway M-ring protein FliF/YscJ
MLSWFKANPLYAAASAGIVLLIAIAAIAAANDYFKHRADKNDATHVELGQKTEQSKQAEETLNAVQKANDAERNPTSNELERVRAKYDRSRH